MCRDNSHHLLKKIFFGFCLCPILIPLYTCLKFAPKWSFSYFQPILEAFFATIATVKVESIQELYTLAIVLIN